MTPQRLVDYRQESWLRDQYLDQHKGTTVIAETQKCNPETIRQWLIRFGIERRPCAIINHIDLTDGLMEMFNGSLLGDGSIVPGKRHGSPRYSISNKHCEYLQYISARLASRGLEQSGRIVPYTNEWGTYWSYHSRYYPELRRLREEWYPGGKKHVPREIALSPSVVRTWFIEDGYFGQTKDSAFGRIQFATNGFSKEETERLAAQLRTEINDCRVHVNKGYPSGHTIVFSKAETVKKFFAYLGPCPLELCNIYGYKWPDEVTS